MKSLLLILCLTCTFTFADDLLKMGSPAPALQVQSWVRADGVDAFKEGTVYVVEFWGTWCGPCVLAMPHLMELQTQYQNEGLKILGITTSEEGEPQEAFKNLTQWIHDQFPNINYSIGFDPTGAMEKTWLEPALAQGVPTSFVVDRKGKIAFIGHPLELDKVLPRVLDGTWQTDTKAIELDHERIQKNKKGNQERDLMNEIYNTLIPAMNSEDWITALDAVERGLELVPSHLDFAVTYFDLLLHKLKRIDQGMLAVKDYAAIQLPSDNAWNMQGALEAIFHPTHDYSYLPRTQRFELGKVLAERILELMPMDKAEPRKFAYYGSIAQFYFESGDRELAIKLGDSAIQTLRDHPLAARMIPHYGPDLAQGLANFKNESVCIGDLCVMPQKGRCETELSAD